jgi:short-subunit dehydrogenase
MIGRRIPFLEATAEDIRNRFSVQVKTFSIDLASENLPEEISKLVSDHDVGLLVHNAAYSEIGHYLDTTLNSKLRHLAVNCRAPMILTSLCVERMAARGRGGIILMSSATSLRGTELLVSYAATKAFSTTLAEGLWQEFQPYGVDVLGVVAGAVRSPNYSKSKPRESRIDATAQEPDDLAHRAVDHLGAGHPIWFSSWQVRLSEILMNRLLTRRAGIRFLSATTRQLYPQAARITKQTDSLGNKAR